MTAVSTKTLMKAKKMSSGLWKRKKTVRKPPDDTVFSCTMVAK